MSAPKLLLKLRDRNPSMADAWRRHFGGLAEVEVTVGDIFGERADAIVSPANSFGFMDGGIDLAYSKFFGWDLQERLQELLKKEHGGELPVSQAVVVETYHAEIPYLVSAPTMRIPMAIPDTLNAYLALRAALRAVRELNARSGAPIQSILCPGLGTAVGQMPHDRCAKQMYAAYANVELGQTWSPPTLGAIVDLHHRLLS